MFKKWSKHLAVSLLILIGFAQTGRADDAKTPPPPKWYDTINVSGFVDAYYSYNSNIPKGGGTNVYHNFDYKSNDLNVSLVELNIVKPVDDKNRAGFYIGLAYGEATEGIACVGSTGTLNCPTSPESPYKNFRQAYASLLLLPGLQLDFGKFVTQHGAEVIESKDNWNYTRSLLFAFAIPYYHSGARLTYSVNDMLYIQGNVTNGWNNVTETNNGKTYGVQVGITPVKPLPIVINYMTGPEIAPATSANDTKSLLDIVATYNVTDALSFMANYDNGIQKQGALGVGGNQDAKWDGYAIYGRYTFASSWATALRYESLNDPNNFAFSGAPNNPSTSGQKVQEATLTLEYSGFGVGSLVRLDLRKDVSDSGVFKNEDGNAGTNQNTVTLGIVQTF